MISVALWLKMCAVPSALDGLVWVSLTVGLSGFGSSDFEPPKLARISGFESGSGNCHD